MGSSQDRTETRSHVHEKVDLLPKLHIDIRQLIHSALVLSSYNHKY